MIQLVEMHVIIEFFLLFHCKVMTLGDPTSSAVDREYGQLSDGSIDPKVSS